MYLICLAVGFSEKQVKCNILLILERSETHGMKTTKL